MSIKAVWEEAIPDKEYLAYGVKHMDDGSSHYLWIHSSNLRFFKSTHVLYWTLYRDEMRQLPPMVVQPT